MAKAAAGVSRSSHSEAPAGRTEATARMYGRTISTMTPVTAPALRRSTVPTPRARTAATASSAAVPTTTRSSISDVTGNTSKPLARSSRSTSGTVTTAATSPVTKVTEPITMAFAARTRPRRGLAARVVRIRPRRYSAVMNNVATTITAISPANAPTRLSPVVPPNDWVVTEYSGEATNNPACTVDDSPARLAVPTLVQCAPSADAYPVIASPERVSRSQRGDAADTAPGRPARSWV